jgi:hypothetical protein
MKLRIYLAGLSLGGLLLSGSVNAVADDEITQEVIIVEQAVTIGYCYMGSSLDPSTGAIVDLYTACTSQPADDSSD